MVAAGQGAFNSPEEAVNEIFAAASKAKRSKTRSFALVHEELGDLLKYPEDLSERAGLRFANAIRDGFSGKLRGVLERAISESPKAEMVMIEEVLAEVESLATSPTDPTAVQEKPDERGRDQRIQLANGVSISRVRKDGFYGTRFDGSSVDDRMIDGVMQHIK